nr:hypothetical protein C5F59_09900 [Streptomyces sp. QL37]
MKRSFSAVTVGAIAGAAFFALAPVAQADAQARWTWTGSSYSSASACRAAAAKIPPPVYGTDCRKDGSVYELWVLVP